MNYLRRLSLLILLALLCVGCSGQSDKDDEELEPARLLPLAPEVGMQRLWKRNLAVNDEMVTSGLDIAYDDGKLYGASVSGSVFCLDAARGTVHWQVDTASRIGGGVGVGNAQVYFGTLDGRVIALAADDGSFRWETELGSEVLSVPVSDGELLVLQTLDGRVFALNPDNGVKVWAYDSSMPVLTMRGTGNPVFFDQLVLVGLANGKLVALDRSTGLVRWERRVAIAQGRSEIERIIDIDANPLLVNGVVYAVSYQGRIVAFHAPSGRPLWSEEESSFLDMDQGFGNIYVTSSEGTVTAYNKQSGAIRWEQNELARRQLGAPVVLGSYVAVSDFEGYLHILSQVDGRIVARRQVDEKGIGTKMLVVSNVLYAYSNSGKFVAYEISDDLDAGFLNSDMPNRIEVMRKRGMHQDKRQ